MNTEDSYFLRYCNDKIDAGIPLTSDERDRYWSLVPTLEVSETEFKYLQKLLEDDII